MSVETDIFAALGPLVSNRVYPDTAPSIVTKPYITYQQVGGRSVSFLESAVPSRRNGRFQINVWGVSRAEVSVLARTVSDTMVTITTLRATPLGEPVADYVDMVKLYGTSQDFGIWFP